jgi:hypothetical protein
VKTNNKSKLVGGFIIGTFVSLYLMVSVISTIHVIDFFKLSNPTWLAVSLAIAFEVGAAASLASLIAMHKMNKTLVWILFFLLTGMQAMGNTYYAYVNLQDFTAWSELFGLIEEDLIFQKRILSIVSGAILPIVALGFIKSLVDYIKPEDGDLDDIVNTNEVNVTEDKTSPYPEFNDEILDLQDSNVNKIYEPVDNSKFDYETENISEESEKLPEQNKIEYPPISTELENANSNKLTHQRVTFPSAGDSNPTRL